MSKGEEKPKSYYTDLPFCLQGLFPFQKRAMNPSFTSFNHFCPPGTGSFSFSYKYSGNVLPLTVVSTPNTYSADEFASATPLNYISITS